MNVRRATALWLSLFFLAVPTAALACALPATVCDQGSAGSFPLIDGGHPARVVIDDGANSAVRAMGRAATMARARDLARASSP